MDLPGIGSIVPALERLVPWLNREQLNYRTVRIDRGGLSYGPKFIARHAISQVTLRSRPLARGTPTRTVLNIGLWAVAFLVTAYLDGNLYQSKLYKILNDGLVATTTWEWWGKVIFLLAVLGVIANTTAAYGAIIAMIAAYLLTKPSTKDMSSTLPRDAFGDFDWVFQSFIHTISTGPLLVIGLLLLGYWHLGIARTKWSWRAIRYWFAHPYFPPPIADRSRPDLAIETTSGSTLWIKLPHYDKANPIEDAMYGAKISSLIRDRMNNPDTAGSDVVDLPSVQVYSGDTSVAVRRLSVGRGREILVANEARVLETTPDEVIREIALLHNDLERVPGYDVTRISLPLSEIEQFAIGLAFGADRRIGDAALLWPSYVKDAKRAARQLANYPQPDAVLHKGFTSHSVDGRLEPIDFHARFEFLSLWVEMRTMPSGSETVLKPEEPIADQ